MKFKYLLGIMRFLTLSLLLVLVPIVGGCSAMPYEKSDHYDGSKFFNPNGPKTKGFFDVIKWMLTSEDAEWPERVEIEPQSPALIPNSNQASTTYINHATHLIQISQLNFLTDPIFSERASPFTWLGPKRVHRPGIDFLNLPKIHFVVISHSHYDHMDFETIRRLGAEHNPLFIVPLGNQKLIEDMGAKRVIELDWWESHKIESSDVTVTLTPAQHWSARGFFDRNKALWGGYIIQNDSLKIYFAGDTGYAPLFSEIKNRFGPVDLSILPIGAYEPRWFMKDHHVNPKEAVQIHIDLESRMSLGTHFGTFQLTSEGINDPKIDLEAALNEMGIPLTTFIVPKPGESHLIEKRRLEAQTSRPTQSFSKGP